MRIRKNRTSSRFTPEFCKAHGIAYYKTDSIRRLDAAVEFKSPQQLELTAATRIVKPSPEPPREVDEGVIAIQNSLETESAPIRIRDLVLRSTGAQNLQTSSQTHESTRSEFESDASRTADNEKQSKSPTDLTEKVKSDASSRPVHRRRKPQKRAPPLHVEPEIPSNPEVTSTKSMMGVSGAGHSSKSQTGGTRKKRRTEADSKPKPVMNTGTAKTRSEDDREPAAASRDILVSSGTTGTTKGRVQGVEERPQENESAEKTPTASLYPAGWSYRGLAQIAEQDKPPQGKQCGRTDGRSWRCPLKVQEGYTLCEHHLGKFRLKKISKDNKRKRFLEWKRKKQFELKHQEQGEHEEDKKEEKQHKQLEQDDEDQRPPLEPPTPDSAPDRNEMVETAQTLATGEHDVPMRNHRKHKTVKLSVL